MTREMPVAIEKIAVLRATLRCRLRGPVAVTRSGTRMARLASAWRHSAARSIGPYGAEAHPMANIHSQKKRILRAERERLENRHYTSAIKTYFRRLEAARAGRRRREQAESEHRVLVSTIDKAVKRGALHRNTGARKKSRAARSARRQVSVSGYVSRRDLRDRAQRERVLIADRERPERAGAHGRRRRACRARGPRAHRARRAGARARCARRPRRSARPRAAASAGRA